MECPEVLRHVRRKIRGVQTDCLLEEDYTIKITTAGTNGFYPEVVYKLGQVFSSGPFHHIGPNSDLSWDLLLPFLYMHEVVIAGVKVSMRTLNSVAFTDNQQSRGPHGSTADTGASKDDAEFIFSQHASQEYRLLIKHQVPPPHSPMEAPLSPRAVQQQEVWTEVGDDDNRFFQFSDLAIDCSRHILVPLSLPKKHKKALKGGVVGWELWLSGVVWLSGLVRLGGMVWMGGVVWLIGVVWLGGVV